MKPIKKVAILILSAPILVATASVIGPISVIKLPFTNAENDKLLQEVPFINVSSMRALNANEAQCLPEFIDEFYSTRGLNVSSSVKYDPNKSNELVIRFVGGYKQGGNTVKQLSQNCKNVNDKLAMESQKIKEAKAVAVAASNVSLQPFTVRSVTFTNNKFITAEELTRLSAVAETIGKEGSVANLDYLVKAVSDHYKKNGFIVTQVRIVDTTSGNVKVNIFEGEIDQITLENTSGLADADILGYASQAVCGQATKLCNGSPIKTDTLERAIGVVSDLPGVTGVSTTMSAGSKLGTSNLKIKVGKAETLTGYASLDNYGGELTGKSRATFGLVGNNLAGIGDQLIGEINKTDVKDNLTGKVGYSIPLGHDGWRTGLLLSRAQSFLGTDEFRSLEYRVVSDSLSLWATYPLIRTRENNLTFRAAVNSGQSTTKIINTADSKSNSSGFTLGLNGRVIDTAILGRSYTSYGLNANFAKVGNTNSTKKNYTMYSLNLSRDQHLVSLNDSSRLSFYVAANHQQPDKKPHYSLRSSIGGVSGVRAYPAGEGGGDITTIGTAELRYNLYVEPTFLTLGLFMDKGWARDYEQGTNNYNKLWRAATGLSANVSILDTFSIRAEYAKKTNASSKPTSNDKADGKEFWLSGSYTF